MAKRDKGQREQKFLKGSNEKKENVPKSEKNFPKFALIM